MRQTSSFSLHRIAAAIVDSPPSFTTTTFAAVMSSTSRPPFRGERGRGRRLFSDRPHAESNIQPVRDSNTSFRNNADFRAVNYNYNSYNYNQNQNNSNYSSNSGGYRGNNYRGRSPPFKQLINQPPGGERPKPAHYRTWELAKQPPPPHCERFVVLSYNILADYLAHRHRKLYFHIPYRFMSWKWRKGNILFELRLWSPDIMCFQEVDKFNDLEEELRIRGYSGIWKMRTGDPVDGCAIFWRTTRFKLMYEESVEFNKHGMRDNVAQMCVLESLIPDKKLASSTSSEGPNRVVICNIHVLYNPRRGEIKLGQVRILLEKAQAISKMWDNAPVVLCGDFNCTPMSPLYNFISEQKLDISEIDRDKISGQASAEIRPPPRRSDFQPREQPTSNIASPSTIQNTSTHKQNDSLENNDNQIPVDSLLHFPANSFEKNRGERQSTDNLSDSQNGHTDISKVEIESANLADLPINESLKGSDSPEFTSVSSNENVISSALPLKEQDIKEVSMSVDSSWISNNDSLSSVTGSSDKNIRENATILEDSDPNTISELNHDTDSSNKNIRENATICEASDPNTISELNHDTDSSNKNIRENATICEASDPNTIAELNHDLSEEFNELSLSEIDESVKVNEDYVEDIEETLSDLNSEGDASPSNLGDLVPEEETVDINKPLYDPSLWTPMEIATATGDAYNTIIEHPLKLRSTYSEAVGSSGTRDSNGEPLVTSYHTCFMGTVDYIWRSEGLCTSKVLAPISVDAMQSSGGFPTKKWGSDHIALASELAFTEK